MTKCLNSVFKGKKEKASESVHTLACCHVQKGRLWGYMASLRTFKKKKKLIHNSLGMAKQRHLLETASKQLIRSCLFDTY